MTNYSPNNDERILRFSKISFINSESEIDGTPFLKC